MAAKGVELICSIWNAACAGSGMAVPGAEDLNLNRSGVNSVGAWLIRLIAADPPFKPSSEQSQAPEARVPLAADHEMIMDRDAERFGGLADLAGHLDVVARRLGIA